MGRGAKIFFCSAFVAALIFGLISFVIISALVDRKKASEEPAETQTAYYETYNYDNNLEER